MVQKFRVISVVVYEIQTFIQYTYRHNVKVKVKEGVCIAIYGNPSHNYGVSLAVWDHTVLPSIRHKRTHFAFTPTPARQAGTRFTDHLRVEG